MNNIWLLHDNYPFSHFDTILPHTRVGVYTVYNMAESEQYYLYVCGKLNLSDGQSI